MCHLILYLAAQLCCAEIVESPAATLQEAEKQLFAGVYKAAAQSYSRALQRDPAESGAYYGLVRTLIRDRRSREAYGAADEALRNNPRTAGAQAAAGLASYRRGDLVKAEEYFRSALRLDPTDAGALAGVASINRAVSRFKTARDLVIAASRKSPGDPDLILDQANSLRGADHVATLRKALAIYDPSTEAARNLRAHIENDLAVGDRKLRQLKSPYQNQRIKLFQILDGPSKLRGFGIRVQLNGRQTVRLLLDTGASGISVSPKVAERAGLEILGDMDTEARGIGDDRPQASYRYVAREVRAADLVFADYPVSVFRAAQSANHDGLIGSDVFQAFLVTIDFPNLELVLEPLADGTSSGAEDLVDANAAPAAGFYRAFRFGNHLAVPTFINGGRSSLFLIDSGSSANLIDTAIARESSDVNRDDSTKVTGVQGKVKEVSRAARISLVFAGFRQDNPDLAAFDLSPVGDSMGVAFGGILGLPALSQLRITIDYRQGTLRLEYKR